MGVPKYLLEQASVLEIGQSIYTYHEDCTPNKKLWLYKSSAGVGFYCNKCGKKGFKKKGIEHVSKIYHANTSTLYTNKNLVVELPEDISYNVEEWPSNARLWLYSADIRNDTIERYGIGYSKKLNRVIIPVYNESKELLTWQGRGLSKEQTKYLNLKNADSGTIFFKSWVTKHHVEEPTKDVCVIVEDALSVIRVGKILPCAAILGTSVSIQQLKFLSKFSKVVIWMDNDKGGQEGSLKLMNRLSLLTEVKRIFTDKDPKKLSNKELREALSCAYS